MSNFLVNSYLQPVAEPDFFTNFTECTNTTCGGAWTSNDISDYYVDTTNNKLIETSGLQNNGALISLGYTASNTAWAMRLHTEITSFVEADGNHHGWCLSNNTTFGNVFAYVGIVCRVDVVSPQVTLNAQPTTFSPNVVLDGDMTDINYYCSLDRTSSTNCNAALSSTSDYNKDIKGDTGLTMSSSIIDLVNFKSNNRYFGNNAEINSELYDITIYDGLTAFP